MPKPRCEIVHYTVPVDGFSMYIGPVKAASRCITHDIDHLPLTTDGPMLCPIGKIEQAVEDGVERIGAIVEKYLKETLSANERAEAERRRRLQLEEEMHADNNNHRAGGAVAPSAD